MESHEAEDATFVDCNANGYATDYRNDGQDDDTMEEETVGDVRAELDEKLAEMARKFDEHSNYMKQEMEHNVKNHTESLKKEMMQGIFGISKDLKQEMMGGLSGAFDKIKAEIDEMKQSFNQFGSEYDADEDAVHPNEATSYYPDDDEDVLSLY